MAERRGSMYDPARDIFTASDEAQPEQEYQAPSSDSNKRKRSPSQLSNVASPATVLQDDTTSNENPAKRVKSSPEASEANKKAPKPMTAANLSKLKSVKKAASDRAIPAPRRPNRRRSRSPSGQPQQEDSSAKKRKTSPRRSEKSPEPIARTPSPSPTRERKRPGAGARINKVDIETARKRQEDRAQADRNAARAEAERRSNLEIVTNHYNSVQEKGREWRKNDSRIKGLRVLNNWVKSAIIHKFGPNEDHLPGTHQVKEPNAPGLLVLDIGCGKGGDLGKWKNLHTSQRVDLYVGLDPANVSIDNAQGRYQQMLRQGNNMRGGRQQRSSLFTGMFCVKDCFGEWIGDIPIIQEVGINGQVGPESAAFQQRFGTGGFDVVSMMFCMHYAFENEEKTRMMLRNVAGSLKKGGRWLGVIPNSDVILSKVKEYNGLNATTEISAAAVEHSTKDDEDEDDWDPEKPSESTSNPQPETQTLTLKRPKQDIDDDVDDDDWDPEKPSEPVAATLSHTDNHEPSSANGASSTETVAAERQDPLEWGNDIYRVKFTSRIPRDNTFRPPYGWKYLYYLEEAVEEIPEFVVPWEALRAMAADYGLELQYRKSFPEVWRAEKDDPELYEVSKNMGVRDKFTGEFMVSEQEMEAAGFYHAFCFYKV